MVDDRAERVAGRRQHRRSNLLQSHARSVGTRLLWQPPMHNTKAVTLVATMLLGGSAFAQSVWTASATQKVRPGDAAGTSTSATLEAARNEFEAFHVVLAGGGGGAKAVTVAADALTGPAGASIADVRVFREGMYNVDHAVEHPGRHRPLARRA